MHIATNKQSYKYVPASWICWFLVSFSDVAQNITSATYKGQVNKSRGGMEGVGGGLRLLYRHNGTSCMPEELSHCPQTTLNG